MDQPEFTYENGISVCSISDNKGHLFIGQAFCHPDDADVMSEYTGCEIAYRRARIKALRFQRDELKVQLQTLNSLYYQMNKSLKFNPHSYENKMLQRNIHRTTEDLATIKEMIAIAQLDLEGYIKNKEKVTKYLRERNKDKGK